MQTLDSGGAFDSIITAYFRNFGAAVERTACHDQYVGDVDGTQYHGDPGAADFVMRTQPDQRPRHRSPIVLVLESPHIREYRTVPPQPAQGSTGRNIRTFLGAALSPLGLNDRHPLILMNAIRHQCSVGVNTAAHRDAIFRRMWEEQCVKEDFARRLRDYTSGEADCRVVNACTKGSDRHTPELWQCVEDTILATLDRPSHLSIRHPASWIRRNGANPVFTR
jgi:hypothetical protein